MIEELISQSPWFIYSSLILLFLIVGSFLNVVIYRVPLMLLEEWRQQCSQLFDIEKQPSSSLNLFLPRSFCPYCKNLIKAWQNIPLLSFLFLRGRCHQCKKPISSRYPLVELLTLVLSLYAVWHFGFTTQLIYILIAIWVLICLIFIDLDCQLLPDGLTLGLLWLGLLANTQDVFISLPEAVYSAAGAYLSLWFFIKLFYLITKKVGMGHGDFKLFAALGAWFGWKILPLALLFSSLTGLILGLAYLRITNKPSDTPIPFGPFLCVSAFIALFWGQDIVHWYGY